MTMEFKTFMGLVVGDELLDLVATVQYRITPGDSGTPGFPASRCQPDIEIMSAKAGGIEISGLLSKAQIRILEQKAAAAANEEARK